MRTLPLSLQATLTLALPACSTGFHSIDSGNPGDGGGGGSGDGGGLATDLPPVDQGLDTGGCEEFSGSPLAGAAAYFLGTYVHTADGWEGEEELRVFANSTWAANGGADCSVFWITSASETDPAGCGNCDLGLAVGASIDVARTTCPKDLSQGEESFSTTYGVDLQDKGTRTNWYFTSTGEEFGQGYARGTPTAPTAMNYGSAKTCQWY